MTVLAREMTAYRDAVEQYQRNAARYNRGATAYNQSLVTDSSGRVYVTDGSKTFAIDPAAGKGPQAGLPNGLQLNQLGRSAMPGDNRYSLLRQNPSERKTEKITATYQEGTGGDLFFGGRREPGYYINNKPVDTNQYRLVEERQDQIPNPNYNLPNFLFGDRRRFIPGPKTGIFERDASVYPNAPGAQPTLSAEKPDPTKAQLRKMNQASQADVERGGLINDVIRSGGLAY